MAITGRGDVFTDQRQEKKKMDSKIVSFDHKVPYEHTSFPSETIIIYLLRYLLWVVEFLKVLSKRRRILQFYSLLRDKIASPKWGVLSMTLNYIK